MKEKTFRPKGFGFVFLISIMSGFLLIGLILFIFGVITNDILYIGLAVIYTVIFGSIFAIPLINLLSYRITITPDYISAPKVKPKIKKNKNIIFKRYGKSVEKISFGDIKKSDIEYELVYRTSYLFLVFVCKDESIKKIDLKLFSKKQVQEIREILKNKQIKFDN